MPIGTPAFNGSKLREAREARGLTAVTLAQLAEVSSAVISQYEHGTRTPPPATVERLATRLNLPVAFFLEPSSDSPEVGLFFRSLAAATKTARTKERRRFAWHVRIAEYLERYVNFGRVNFPRPSLLGDDALSLSDEDLEEIARELRSVWDLGSAPIGDVVELLEGQGAIVVRCEIGSNSLDAYSTWVNGRPHIVLGSDKNAAVRSRYDAAHELCHLILHREVSSAALNTPQQMREIERQAGFFAGSFLLPAESFAGDFTIPTLDGLLAMKPKWKVSVGAMIQRARWLGLISEQQQARMWISYRRRWGTREPFDDSLPFEEPRVLMKAFELLKESRAMAVGEVRTSLPFSTSDIEQLSGLADGYLQVLRGGVSAPSSVRLLHFPGTFNGVSEE